MNYSMKPEDLREPQDRDSEANSILKSPRLTDRLKSLPARRALNPLKVDALHFVGGNWPTAVRAYIVSRDARTLSRLTFLAIDHAVRHSLCVAFCWPDGLQLSPDCA